VKNTQAARNEKWVLVAISYVAIGLAILCVLICVAGLIVDTYIEHGHRRELAERVYQLDDAALAQQYVRLVVRKDATQIDWQSFERAITAAEQAVACERLFPDLLRAKVGTQSGRKYVEHVLTTAKEER